jgi:hypothetical protein
MAELLRSDKVIPKGQVGSVVEDPLEKFRLEHKERMHRFYVIVIFGLLFNILCIYIIVSGNTELHDYRSGAWGFLSAFGGGFIVYLTGAGAGSDGRRNHGS